MIFITQGRYTEHALEGMLAKPEDRTVAFSQLLSAAGARLIDAYWTMGESDFLVIVEAENEHEWMKILALTASTGGLRDLKTMVAVTTADGEKAFEGARALKASFHPAGED
ncbi:MAG: GYD domain-containing protein [Bauldia sp.]|nr:GYD domain-containing protein [Bauldia sp.]